MDLITKKAEQSAALSDEVAEFLANGGSIDQMRPCSAKESLFRSGKPYSKVSKDGKRYISRNYTKHRPDRDAMGGHCTK